MAILCSEPKTLKLPLLTPKTISSCNSLSSLKQNHALLLKSPFSDPNLFPKLITSYHRLGDPSSALLALDRSPQTPDAFFFNSLIQFYISKSRFLCAIGLYPKMISLGVSPNQYSFPLLFKACSSSLELSLGTQLHAHSIKFGFLANLFVSVALMDMYMKNGKVQSAQRVFDGMIERDTVAWNALVTGYTQNGKPEEALLVYNRMCSAGFVVGQLGIASIITACSQLQFLHQGKLIHSWVVKSGFMYDTVIATALLEMYANCGDIKLAKQVFDEMHVKDLISWNCLISSCAQNGCVEDAVRYLFDMQCSGLKANGSSLAGILPALAHSGMLNLGKSCHGFAIRNGLESDEFVLTALLDVYAKSGDLLVAHKLFNTLVNKKSIVAWSAIITGYGLHGQGTKALNLFEEMLASNVRPNHVTYVGVLLACAHSGLVNKGKEYLQRMLQEHGIAPRSQHFACMVDLLARAGQFDEAMGLIRSMPIEPNPSIWGSLLSGCKIHGNIDLAKYAADRLFELHPSDPGFYVLLSNTYAAAGMWEEVRQVRSLMRERGLRKAAGWSSIEVGRKVTCFISGDTSHPESSEIYKKLEEMLKETASEGYVPRTEIVLHNVEEDMKANVLKVHSEKLAMAYGLLRTPPGRTIRIMKNLRICEDCHMFAKHLSVVTSKEIILRDAVRFHHISSGSCTCADYW